METVIKKSYPVTGMSCAGCAVSVETMLKSVTGVRNAGVNFANQTAWVEYSSGTVSPETLKSTVQSIGYDLITDNDNAKELQEEAQRKQYLEIKNRTIWASVL